MPEQITSPLSRFARGFFLPVKGLKLILSSPGCRRWAIAPLAVNFILYIGIIFLAFWLIDTIQLPQAEWDLWDGWLADTVNSLGGFIKWLVLLPVVFIFCYLTFTFFGETISGPFNDILSEKLENRITGRAPESAPLRLTFSSTLISISSSLRFLLQQAVLLIITLPVLLIPFAGTFIWFMINAYYIGITYMDTGMARNYLHYRHKMPGIRHSRLEVLGLGSAIGLLLLIPFAGMLIIPLGVSAGTILYCDVDWSQVLAKSGLEPPGEFVPPVKKS